MPKLRPRRSLRKGKSVIKNKAYKRKRWTRDSLIRRSGGLCEYCGKQLQAAGMATDSATLDHVVPRSRGGLDVLKNMRVACRECNQDKGAMFLDAWMDSDGDDYDAELAADRILEQQEMEEIDGGD